MFDLPEHLAERCRMANSILELHGHGQLSYGSNHLYGHEESALDAGRILINKFNRPLLIYQGIDERYPHANARHHNVYWMLLDMHHGCKQLGIDYVLHVARDVYRPLS